MNVRPDVVELLHAGYGDRTIARHLGVSIGTIRRTRTTLQLPAGRPGPKAPGTPEDLFWLRTQPLEDGHLQWTGTFHQGVTPTLRHAGRRYTAYRIAFGIAHQRKPVGRVAPGCGQPGCVHPRHVEDRLIRQRISSTFTAIFGAAA